eukprot:scaffold47_cov258-Pinguiococcus_pyrenoidosus.AAC.82
MLRRREVRALGEKPAAKAADFPLLVQAVTPTRSMHDDRGVRENALTGRDVDLGFVHRAALHVV